MIKLGVGIILEPEGKILLGRRKGSDGEGQFAPPAGHVEANESIEACVYRELVEETSLKPKKIVKGPWVEHFNDTRHYLCLFVIVTEFEGNVQLLEPHKCEGWQWFDWNSLPKPLFYPFQTLVTQSCWKPF